MGRWGKKAQGTNCSCVTNYSNLRRTKQFSNNGESQSYEQTMENSNGVRRPEYAPENATWAGGLF